MANRDPKMMELLDKLLDEQLVGADREEALRLVESNPEFAEQVALQRRIDAAVRETYAPPRDLDIVPAELKSTLEPSAPDGYPPHTNDGRNPKSRRSRVILLAVAASVAWIAVAANIFWPRGGREIAYHAKPLTDVYQVCVDEGFRPYWVCDNDFLFAATFERRQGIPLQLADMPAGVEMVGLSYLAGLSRKSTSMLALVDDQPVLVIADRKERDWGPKTGAFEEVGLNVHRFEKFGLVLYEVSPFPQAHVVQYFTVAAKKSEDK